MTSGLVAAIVLALATPARATERSQASEEAPCWRVPGRDGGEDAVACKPQFMLILRDGYLDSAAEAQTCKVRLADALADQQPGYAYQGAPPWVAVAGVVAGVVLGGLAVYAVSR